VALDFAREDADILISYLNGDLDAEETARVVRKAGHRAVLAPGDILEEADCRSLVERTVSELGKLDILVNNAADQMTWEGIAQVPDCDWEHTFWTNVPCPQ
jgi:NAD(P)-dependent dehydrogenase (short-subunit alcohol dehydrogenase family)